MLADALTVVPGVDGPEPRRAVAGGMGILTMLLFDLLAFGLAALTGVAGVVWLPLPERGAPRAATAE